ncbi:MAG: hypothetical protein A2270_11730 [Elusimicrobia bacterium RIFOXYA12_FULL_51_18]|nr:MAG: hypothetical protein A2270_11730 [Elusimicrobia bacterium RIFOXYA12_FULL_51_18]OGS28834.1 MAG: hypothetical protein A2218_09190 [Elusimicrobia bacterium RIFOXYA2_FULL_53_38]
MNLVPIDWIVIVGYLAFCLWVGYRFSNRASKDMESYFLSGRDLPWWILGTSMVATTFASDTPLAITEFIRDGGIWKNWFWWSLAMGSGLSIFLFAPLWRRVGVLTDNELIEVRYEGKSAAFLRCFKALYFSILYNVIVMGWVIKGMVTVISITLGVPEIPTIIVCLIVTLFYTITSGLWGVVITDVLQFGVAMAGSIFMAVFAVSSLGGMSALLGKLSQMPGFHPGTLSFLPPVDLSSIKTPFSTVMIYALVIWWSSNGSDGGGYIIQRMMAAKNEKHATVGTLWFAVWHYALRVWPWIVVGMVSMVMFPDLSAHEFKDKAGYPMVMRAVLPAGLMGIMVAYFLGAFMSTIDTHTNWGASYIINDIYKRFIKPQASDSHYVLVSRIASVSIMAIAGYVAFTWIDSISETWQFVYLMGSGIGLVLISRWFWWRVNAYSEIAALTSSLLLTVGWVVLAKLLPDVQFLGYPLGLVPLHVKVLVVVPASIIVWLTVTFITKPVSKEKLAIFYERARPGGWWSPVIGDKHYDGEVLCFNFFVKWLAALFIIFGILFGLGHMIFLRWAWGFGLLALAAAGCWILYKLDILNLEDA